MSPEFSFLLLLAATLIWLLLPLVPAVMELWRPRDAAPLQSVGSDSGKLTYFATSFTQRAQRDGLLGTMLPPRLSDGTPVIGISRNVPLFDTRKPTEAVVVLMDSVPLPEGVEFSGEVLARLSMPASRRYTFRAILGQRDVGLGEGSTVLRWVHALGLLEVGNGCRLYGRATSGRTITLGTNVFFERLQAPVIRVTAQESYEPPARPTGSYELFRADGAEQIAEGYWRFDGDLRIPSDSMFIGSIVCRGTLVVEEGARVTGSIKTHGDLLVRRRAIIEGSLAARERIVVEEGARISGPLIAEDSITLDAAVIGSATSPSTVTAPLIDLLPGATVYGAIMAGRRGTTRSH